jgi:hypothetical protein
MIIALATAAAVPGRLCDSLGLGHKERSEAEDDKQIEEWLAERTKPRRGTGCRATRTFVGDEIAGRLVMNLQRRRKEVWIIGISPLADVKSPRPLCCTT